MGDRFVALAILSILTIVVANMPPMRPDRLLEGPARVVDGDSLLVNNMRVRLRGIDAPELTQTCQTGGATYPCGRQAQQALLQLVAGKNVSCQNHGSDRYGRILATCMVGVVELNHSMVAAGWAVAYGDYHTQERAARQAKLGLWRGEFMTPQEWRRQHSGKDEASHDLLVDFWGWLSGLFEI